MPSCLMVTCVTVSWGPKHSGEGPGPAVAGLSPFSRQHRIQRLGGGGRRNMKSMWPPLAAIFFMTYFYRGGTPLDPLLGRLDSGPTSQ